MNYNDVYKYLKGIKDIKIPLIYKILFVPIFGVFLCVLGFFISARYPAYSLLIYAFLIILFGLCAFVIILIRAYAPQFVLELVKIKMRRKPNECIIFFVDELGIMDSSIGEIDFSVREVKDKATGLRYEFTDDDVVYYYRVPVIFVSGMSGRAIPAKYVNALHRLKELGFKNFRDVKKFVEKIDKKIGENNLKIKELMAEYEVTKDEKLKNEISRLEKETEQMKKLLEEVEEAISTLPMQPLKLKNIVNFLGNENPEIKLAKANRYYLAGYLRGMKDEGFIQILKWITLLAAIIAIPVVAYVIVKSMGGL
ncbi:hypothetical protein [Methanocaldococcus sp.]